MAMHIAACSPLALTEEDLPVDILEREKRVYSEQAKDSGKPDEIIQNMVILLMISLILLINV